MAFTFSRFLFKISCSVISNVWSGSTLVVDALTCEICSRSNWVQRGIIEGPCPHLPGKNLNAEFFLLYNQSRNATVASHLVLWIHSRGRILWVTVLGIRSRNCAGLDNNEFGWHGEYCERRKKRMWGKSRVSKNSCEEARLGKLVWVRLCRFSSARMRNTDPKPHAVSYGPVGGIGLTLPLRQLHKLDQIPKRNKQSCK